MFLTTESPLQHPDFSICKIDIEILNYWIAMKIRNNFYKKLPINTWSHQQNCFICCTIIIITTTTTTTTKSNLLEGSFINNGTTKPCLCSWLYIFLCLLGSVTTFLPIFVFYNMGKIVVGPISQVVVGSKWMKDAETRQCS